MDLINSEIVIVGDDVVKVIDILKFFVVLLLSYFSKFVFSNF